MTTNRQHGFTLIEVMVAMIVATLGMLAVTLPAITAGSNAIKLREQSLAHWVAMNQATELRLTTPWPETGRSDGDIEFAGIEWRWVTEIEATDVEALRRAEISVSFADNPDKEVARVIAFIGEPVLGMTYRPWTGTPTNTPGPGAGDGSDPRFNPGNNRRPGS